MQIADHPRLNRALLDYAEANPNDRTHVDKRVWNTFGQTQSVVVVDMANFSLITHKQGIVYYLSLIQTMQRIMLEHVQKHDGILIKFVADNAFFIMDDVNRAVKCLIEINQTLEQHNENTPEMWDVEICCGLCFGDILNINNTDIFGEPVNTAARLGEDIAKPWEILISKQAMSQLSPDFRQNIELTEQNHPDVINPFFKIDKGAICSYG